MSNKRPRLDIPKSETERLFDWITIGGLILLFALPAMYYGSLPEEIPTHFNGKGDADNWGNKIYIWILPGIGLLMAIIMNYLTTIPHHYNYPVDITEENAEFQYQRGRKIIRFFNAFDTILFVFITWVMIQDAKGIETPLSSWMLPIILLATAGAVGYTFYNNSSKKV